MDALFTQLQGIRRAVQEERQERPGCSAQRPDGPHVWVVARNRAVQQCRVCRRLRMRPGYEAE